MLDAAGERRQTAAFKAAIGDVVDIGLEVFEPQAHRVDGQAVTNEILLKGYRLAHQAAKLLLVFRGPYLPVLLDQVHEQVTEDLDVVGLVPEGVPEHLADPREL